MIHSNKTEKFLFCVGVKEMVKCLLTGQLILNYSHFATGCVAVKRKFTAVTYKYLRKKTNLLILS